MKIFEIQKPGSDVILAIEIEPIRKPYSKLLIGGQVVVRQLRERIVEGGQTYRMDYGIVRVLRQKYLDKAVRANSKKSAALFAELREQAGFEI